jgi:hypothetical protein
VGASISVNDLRWARLLTKGFVSALRPEGWWGPKGRAAARARACVEGLVLHMRGRAPVSQQQRRPHEDA